MKRIQAACVCQTLHFGVREDGEHDWAVGQCRLDVEMYKRAMARKGTNHKILEETVQEDGSVVMKIIKQYNHYPVGDYLE